MSSLTIKIPPELKQRLKDAADARGQELGEYARVLLEVGLLLTGSRADQSVNGEKLPRWTAEEAEALARAQGVPLAANVTDLVGDFWPEDESCDEFIATVRPWRRKGVGGGDANLSE